MRGFLLTMFLPVLAACASESDSEAACRTQIQTLVAERDRYFEEELSRLVQSARVEQGGQGFKGQISTTMEFPSGEIELDGIAEIPDKDKEAWSKFGSKWNQLNKGIYALRDRCPEAFETTLSDYQDSLPSVGPSDD